MGNNRIENSCIDKTSWPIGAWKKEPDLVFWIDEETQYPCFIMRMPDSGHLCGYVVIKQGNFFFDKKWDNGGEMLDVHGGITYGASYSGTFIENNFKKHIPFIDENSWVLGFDCSHAGDVRPASNNAIYANEFYRDIFYVTKQVVSLAYQLKIIGEDNELIGLSIKREQIREELKEIESKIENKISFLKNKE